MVWGGETVKGTMWKVRQTFLKHRCYSYIYLEIYQNRHIVLWCHSQANVEPSTLQPTSSEMDMASILASHPNPRNTELKHLL